MNTLITKKLINCFTLMLMLVAINFSQNPIQIENALQGTTDWQIDFKSDDGALDHEVEGYASKTSVNIGETIQFYFNTSQTQTIYFEIYRLGYYAGTGGRLYYSGHAVNVTPKPFPIPDSYTGLAECNWLTPSSAQWYVPTTAVSGVYLVKLHGGLNEKESYISFVVRDDTRNSDVLFQRSVTTDQAYNNYPGILYGGSEIYSNSANGKSLYQEYSYGPDLSGTRTAGFQRQAKKVSFNRPYWLTYAGRGIYDTAGATLFAYDYNLLRWLEKEGYDVSYCTDIDTHTADSTNGRLSAGRHKVLMTGGHDEYWSWNMRDNVEQARDRTTQPLNLAFMGGNSVYWQVRFDNSSATGTYPAGSMNRTMISYKETSKSNLLVERDPIFDDGDPALFHLITNKWRENQGNNGTVSKPPEDELIGVMYSETPLFCCSTSEAVILDTSPSWVIDGVSLKPMAGLIGYEADRLHGTYSTRTVNLIGESPYRNKFGTPLGNSNMTIYFRNSNSSRVFAAGTLQWSWGLDNFGTDSAFPFRAPYENASAKRLTSNILGCLINGNCGS